MFTYNNLNHGHTMEKTNPRSMGPQGTLLGYGLLLWRDTLEKLRTELTTRQHYLSELPCLPSQCHRIFVSAAQCPGR